MKKREVLAFDLGASNGRGILADYDGSRIHLREINRFSNSFNLMGGRAYWDVLRLIDNVKQGICVCDPVPESIGIDTWGVDFGLLDKTGGLISNPRSYRDDAFSIENMAEAMTRIGSESWLFYQTYLLNWEINPPFKLYYMKKYGQESLESVDTLLMMPNLIEYFLTGIKHSEYTTSATSQLFNLKKKCWAESLLDKLDIPKTWFTPVGYAGEILGPLSADVIRETGRRDLKVISVAGHDTASAALAAPARSKEFIFISSGTWSLMGFCSSKLLEDEKILSCRISNEGSWDGTYRPTVNISGLWILQECHRQWGNTGEQYSYDDLDAMALVEKPLQSLIRPDDFEKTGDYPRLIREYCQRTAQPVPEKPGQVVRCILESLALKYRQAFDMFKPYMNRQEAMYVVGGGVRNRLLNQFAANALNLPVITGPAEATAVGNILIQLEALGEVKGADQRSEIIKNSFESEVFMPQDKEVWEEAYGRFCGLYRYWGAEEKPT
ncbi:rhamnulokinase [Treponema primitia]|uniref:rhamnulokinase n=1 Tax=Treponema primitia TaxID=88058 RepID=UPI000255561E|nr:rhamnulokinase family protein [Treponema primitia]